jgi:putative hydrolase of the HAD superfamily
MKAVLFDAGDTLFRVRGSVGDAYATVAARHGVIVTPQDIEPRFRAAFRQMPPLAFPDAPPDQLPQREYAWWRQVVASAFSGERFPDFDTFFRELFEYFADAAAWALFSDTPAALARLQARGLRLGLVSNFDGRLVSICEGLGIAGAFDVIVMSGRAGYAKPDPRIFRIALASLGVTPDEALHVGDSAREDVAGAAAAGLRAVLVQRDAAVGRAPHAMPPDTVRSLRQLTARL